jgi:hypothetical protein
MATAMGEAKVAKGIAEVLPSLDVERSRGTGKQRKDVHLTNVSIPIRGSPPWPFTSLHHIRCTGTIPTYARI